MLERAFLKQFFNWLDSATLPELMERQVQAQTALDGFREPDARRDMRFLLKHIQREILERHFLPAPSNKK